MVKKILLLYLGRKGAGPVYSLEMAKALVGQGVKIHAIISSYIENRKEWEASAENLNFKVNFIETYKSIKGFAKQLFTRRFHRNIGKMINDNQPSFVYVPMRSLLDSLILDYVEKTIPIVVTIHDVKLHSGEANLIDDFLKKRTARKANKMVVLSEKFIEEVSNKFKIDKKDIIHIPHANFNYYRKNTPKFDKLNNNLLFFGRIHTYKGVDILLEAFNLIHKRLPNLTLTIAGEGQFSKKEEKLLEKLGSSVRLIQGWIDDDKVEELFEACDLVLLTYREASQSGVIPLAYSMGRGVITSNVGGLSEQIAPGSYPLIGSLKPEDFANIVIESYKEKKISAVNNLVYEYSKNNMSWENSAKLLKSIYED